LSLFIMLAEGVKLCLVLCFNLYLHHLPETPIEPSLFDSLQLLVLSNPVNMLFLFAFSLHFTLLMLI